MKTFNRVLFLLPVLLLAACRPSTARLPAPTSLPPLPVAAAATLPPAATQTPAPGPSPQSTPTSDPAVQRVVEYAAALQSGDFDAAAAMLSGYSLMAREMTRGEAAAELQSRLAAESWSDFSIGETQAAGSGTILAHVAYRVETVDPKTGDKTAARVDEWWPLRMENGAWRCNYANLIDFRTLDVSAQTTAGLTLKPRRIERYTDRIRLTLMGQNRTGDPIVLGQSNEILALFSFGGQRLEAEPARLVFEPLRSVPEVQLEVKGRFDAYPDGVVIRQWKDYQVPPWFDFQLTW